MRSYHQLVIVAFALSGCVSGIPGASGTRAVINDCALKAQMDSGYQVIEVDGKPVERARSSIHTVIPNALVSPGVRTLRFEKENRE